MAYTISMYGIQILCLISETTSNLLQPAYSIKLFNTETVILSLGEPDDAKNNDLEIVKAPPGKSALEKKMGQFHKYVNLVEMTEGLEKGALYKSFNKLKTPGLPVPYSDSSSGQPEGDDKLAKRPTKKKRKRKRLRSTNLPRLRRSTRIKKRQVVEEAATEETEEQEEGDATQEVPLEKEYLDYVDEKIKSDSAFKYSDEGKPEENLKEIIVKITDTRTPENCTEVTGIGLQAVECVVKNYRRGQLDQRHMIYSISLIVFAWFVVYLAIALPFWCVKGWCCCCFRCDFCLPNKTVGEIQQYILQNPPGVYINSKGEEERYNPTQNEIELYERLKRLINDF